MDKKLNELREEINPIDKKIVDLIAKRISLVKEIAEIKKKNNLEIIDKNREIEIIKEKQELARELNISQDLINRIFEEIIKNSVKIQKEIKNEIFPK